jgi:sugar phosphate permease
VDQVSTKAIRGQAQGFLVLMTYGAGMFIGAQISGWVHNAVVTSTGAAAATEWQTFWTIPAVLAAAVVVVFMIFFRDGRSPAGDAVPSA